MRRARLANSKRLSRHSFFDSPSFDAPQAVEFQHGEPLRPDGFRPAMESGAVDRLSRAPWHALPFTSILVPPGSIASRGYRTRSSEGCPSGRASGGEYANTWCVIYADRVKTIRSRARAIVRWAVAHFARVGRDSRLS